MYNTNLFRDSFAGRTRQSFPAVREDSNKATVLPKTAFGRLPAAAILLLSWFGA
jgi:hypothetical protein